MTGKALDVTAVAAPGVLHGSVTGRESWDAALSARGLTGSLVLTSSAAGFRAALARAAADGEFLLLPADDTPADALLEGLDATVVRVDLDALPAGTRIVDWEYAGMGDRFFDLANFSVNHELSEAESETLLDAYFGEVADDESKKVVDAIEGVRTGMGDRPVEDVTINSIDIEQL